MKRSSQLTPQHGRSVARAGLAIALALTGQSLLAATIVKSNNSLSLTNSASWTNNVIPGAADTAQWDSTVSTAANCTNVLGGSMTWNGLTVLNPAAPVQINADGNTLTLTNLTLSGADLTLNCGLLVGGNPTWNLANSSRTLAIGTAMGGNGNIKQQYGTLRLAPGSGSLPAGMNYSWSGTGTLDLGGNSQTLLTLGSPWGATGIVTNGNLALSLASGDFNPNPQGNNSVQDLSGLSSFIVNNVARSINFNVGGTTAGTFNIYLYLAAAGSGTNFLAVNGLNIGTGSSISSGTSPMSFLYLGQNNVINANTIQVAGYKGSGSILFNRGLLSPSVTIRGTNGVDRLPNWIVGTATTGAYNEVGTNDFTGGTIDCMATNILVGQHNAGANNSLYGVLTIDGAASSVDVLNLTLAQKTVTANSPIVNGTLNQLNGTVKVASLTLGDNKGSSTGVNIQSAYKLGNGTLRAQTIQNGTIGASENAASYRTLFWTNGVIANYDANTDLTMSSGTISAAGSGARSFAPDAGRTITVQGKLAQAAGATPIVKDGPGTLVLQGATDNPSLGLNVSNGVAVLDKPSSSTVHALGLDSVINGGTLQLGATFGGGDQIYDSRSLTLNSGAFDLNGMSETIAGLAGIGGAVTDSSGYGGALTLNVPSSTNFAFGGSFSNSFDLVKNGPGKQTFFGTDYRLGGSMTVKQGTLEIGNGSGTGALANAITVNQGAMLSFNRANTYNFTCSLSGAGDLAQNGSGTLVLAGSDSHSGNTLVNTGTLAIAPGASAVAGSVITVNPGATLDLSASASVALTSQTLTGAGTINGSLFLGTSSLLAGTLTFNNGTLASGEASTNAPGGLLQAGTTTVNGNYVNGLNSYLVYDLASTTNAGGGINDLLVVSGNFDLRQKCYLVINGTPTTGVYTLATFGSFTGSAANLQVQGSSRYSFVPSVRGNSLILTVSGNPANLVWQGDGMANSWDNNSGSLDWLNQGITDAFNPGDNVTFDDSSMNPTVNITATVLPTTVTVNATKDYTFANAGGSIDGTAVLTKTNSGTLTIVTNNTFTGPVNLNGGTISIASVAPNGSPSPLGSGSVLAFNGGTLKYTGSGVGVGGFGRQLVLGPNGGTIDQESPSTSIYFFVTNKITGPGNLTKTGPSQLILGDGPSATGSNDYSGITYINNGNLQIRNANALGSTSAKTVINAGGSLSADGNFTGVIMKNIDLVGGTLSGGSANYNYGGAITLVSNSLVGSSYPITISGAITGPGQMQKTGSGTLTLLNSANSYAGGTYIAGGTLQLGTNETTGWLAPQPAGVAITNNGVLAFNLATTNTLSDSITGTGGISQNGSGTTILAGASDFTGNVNLNNGVLRAAANNALGLGNVYLPGGSTVAPLELAGNCSLSNAMFQLAMHNGHTPHIRNVSGTNTLLGTLDLEPGGANWDISSDGGYLIIAAHIYPGQNSGGGWRTLYLNGAAGGMITGVYDQSRITGSTTNINLEVTGGTWTLATNGIYSGSTTVDAGATLLAANTPDGSATGSGTVSVNGTLGGNGYIAGSATINTNGTLSPGLGLGTLTFNANLTLAGNLLVELNKNSLVQSNDQVSVAGVLTNSGTGTVFVANLGPDLVVGDTFYLFNKAMANGAALTISGPAGVTFANNLAVDGSITVSAVAPATPPPAITSLLPNSGRTNGGTVVTITGSNFLSGVTVQFGGLPAPSVTLVDTNTITVATPAHVPGWVDVSVVNTNGLSATKIGAFNYVLPPAPATLTSATKSGSSLQMVWSGGAGASCTLFSSTNVSLPRSNWLAVATNVVDGSGSSTNTIQVNTSEPKRFYLLSIPYN